MTTRVCINIEDEKVKNMKAALNYFGFDSVKHFLEKSMDQLFLEYNDLNVEDDILNLKEN